MEELAGRSARRRRTQRGEVCNARSFRHAGAQPLLAEQTRRTRHDRQCCGHGELPEKAGRILCLGEIGVWSDALGATRANVRHEVRVRRASRLAVKLELTPSEGAR